MTFTGFAQTAVFCIPQIIHMKTLVHTIILFAFTGLFSCAGNEKEDYVDKDLPIRPLAVAANGERFSDPAKVEKWFGRNCKEVVGRACTPGEKADFVAYMSEVH